MKTEPRLTVEKFMAAREIGKELFKTLEHEHDSPQVVVSILIQAMCSSVCAGARSAEAMITFLDEIGAQMRPIMKMTAQEMLAEVEKKP